MTPADDKLLAACGEAVAVALGLPDGKGRMAIAAALRPVLAGLCGDWSEVDSPAVSRPKCPQHNPVRLLPAPAAQGWTVVTDDPATWPAHDETRIVILWAGRTTGFGRFQSLGTGRELSDSALKKERGTIGSAWLALPPWPGDAAREARQ